MSKQDKIMVNPSEGYFLAKRQMVETIDKRLEKLNQEPEKNKEIIKEVENLRNYVRNVMLWFKGDGE